MVIENLLTCYHCGDDCKSTIIEKDEKNFCCNGCLQVYQILSESKLSNYYALNPHPGKTQLVSNKKFAYLDHNEIKEKLIDYQDEKQCTVSFYIPAIHCSSCIWLLENLHTLHKGIFENRVDFLKKQVDIRFDAHLISLRKLAELLQQIGYEPLIQLNQSKNKVLRRDPLTLKIALAGFCFGNVMLLSFPAYFGLGNQDKIYGHFFQLLSLLFAIPSVFYASADYFKQAYLSLKLKLLDINFPLALGILVLFLRTLIDYLTHTGEGFADSLTGLIFFLLIGKWVQQKTYYHLSFERDYRSFFPMAVQVIDNKNKEINIPLEKLKKGDRLLVRNQEIIPADAILLQGEALIDFSFVTGESVPIKKVLGEIIYAGGKQCGTSIQLEVIKPLSQSYLTSLWNHDAFKKNHKNGAQNFINKVAKHFTWVLLLVASLTFSYHAFFNLHTAINAFTSILIVACPCALALGYSFTMAAALSIFDKNKFYLKNAQVVEQLANINHIVFDKTGTLTLLEKENVVFEGSITEFDKAIIYAVCSHSAHPLSMRICSYLKQDSDKKTVISSFKEHQGMGLEAVILNQKIKIGNPMFVLGASASTSHLPQVYIKIGEKYVGKFTFKQQLRTKFHETLTQLNYRYKTYLLSGDNASGQQEIAQFFPHKNQLHFNQSPKEKLLFIDNLQQKGAQVLMLGDGLNDAGALKKSHVGIAITDEINNFTPNSDAILEGNSFEKIPQFLAFSKASLKVVHRALYISLIYNLIGLSFAITGNLSPLIAAILMPISTISIVTLCSFGTHRAAKKLHLNL